MQAQQQGRGGRGTPHAIGHADGIHRHYIKYSLLVARGVSCYAHVIKYVWIVVSGSTYATLDATEIGEPRKETA